MLILIPVAALAHPPYAKKQGHITTPERKTLVTEKLYGDGILTSDPVSFQIRNHHGAVIANTKASVNIASFCPTIQVCWVLPYRASSIIEIASYADWEQININAPAPEYDFKHDEQEKFAQYLADKTLRSFRSYALGYPEFNKTHGGFTRSPPTAILSPLLIIVDNLLTLLTIIPMTLLHFALFWLFFKWKNPDKAVLRYTIGTVVMLGYCGLYIVILFIMGYFLVTPWAYMLLFIAISLRIGIRKSLIPRHFG